MAPNIKLPNEKHASQSLYAQAGETYQETCKESPLSGFYTTLVKFLYRPFEASSYSLEGNGIGISINIPFSHRSAFNNRIFNDFFDKNTVQNFQDWLKKGNCPPPDDSNGSGQGRIIYKFAFIRRRYSAYTEGYLNPLNIVPANPNTRAETPASSLMRKTLDSLAYYLFSTPSTFSVVGAQVAPPLTGMTPAFVR